MESKTFPPFRPLLIAAAILILIGWGGFALAVFTLEPLVWVRWLFFLCGILGLTGLALPVVWFLHLRFPSTPRVGVQIILRQALWVGIFGALMAWLQQEQLVTIWLAAGLAAGTVAIEYLIRMREVARWQPKSAEEVGEQSEQ